MCNFFFFFKTLSIKNVSLQQFLKINFQSEHRPPEKLTLDNLHEGNVRHFIFLMEKTNVYVEGMNWLANKYILYSTPLTYQALFLGM